MIRVGVAHTAELAIRTSDAKLQRQHGQRGQGAPRQEQERVSEGSAMLRRGTHKEAPTGTGDCPCRR